MTRGTRQALIQFAWHDVTCAEGSRCRDRPIHALASPTANSGVLAAFLDRLEELIAIHDREATG